MNEFKSEAFNINAGVPQGSVLGSLLYGIFTADLPTSNSVMTSTFADDTAILSSHYTAAEASHQLQLHLSIIETWLANWRIQVNATKSTHVNHMFK